MISKKGRLAPLPISIGFKILSAMPTTSTPQQQEQLRATVGAGDNALTEAYSDLLAQLAQRIAAQLPVAER